MLLDRPPSPGMIPQPRSTTARAFTGRSAPAENDLWNTRVQRRQGVASAAVMDKTIGAVEEGAHRDPVNRANV